MPAAFHSPHYVSFGNVLDPRFGVIVWIVFEDDALHSILRFTNPSLIQVVQDGFQFRLGTGDITSIGNRDVE